jgi:hypothetical protein
VLRLVENIQRERLRGIDLVRGVAALLPAFGGNQTAVADAIGKSKSYVSRCCRAASVLEAAGVATSQQEFSAGQLFELAYASASATCFEPVCPCQECRRQFPGSRVGAVYLGSECLRQCGRTVLHA